MSRLELDPVGGILHGVAELSALQHGDIVVIVPESHGLRRRNAHAFLKFPERSALGDALAHNVHPAVAGNEQLVLIPQGIPHGRICLTGRSVGVAQGDFQNRLVYRIEHIIGNNLGITVIPLDLTLHGGVVVFRVIMWWKPHSTGTAVDS